MIDSSSKKPPATYPTYVSPVGVRKEEGQEPPKQGVQAYSRKCLSGMGSGKEGGWRDASVNDAGRVIGEHHHKAKLSDEDIELILELRDAGLSYGQIAAKFDDEPRVSKTQVWNVCNGVRRRQTVMGHKRVSRRPDFMPADLDEFDIVGGF